MKKSLLDEIAEHLGCDCLSDLRIWPDARAFLDCIDSIPPNAYALIQWNECAHYLTTETKTFDSESEVRRFLADAKQSD